jgi:hypothetical protein
LIIAQAELDTRNYAEIEVVATLRLVDLRGNGPVRMGIPSDVIGSSSQRLSRKLSLAFYNHPSQPGRDYLTLAAQRRNEPCDL